MNWFEPWIILFYLQLLLILFPIFLFGVLVLKRITINLNWTLLIPAGIILGLTLFIFLLNFSSNILPGKSGIWLSYIFVFFLTIGLLSFEKWKRPNFNKKVTLLWLLSLILWFGLVAWKANFALIGGDTRSYYAIAGSYIKGNFPPVTPWQPDVDLAYHIGSFELLGALSYLSGVSFLPLHLILSTIFIVSSILILIWIINDKFSVSKFVIANIAVFVSFISFGFVKVVYLIFPLKFPDGDNLSDLVIWLRNLPSARESIELYGVSYNLDSLIYILFQNSGLGILFCVLVILLNFKKNFFSVFILLITLATLALVNESILIPVLVPVFLWIAFSFSKKILSKEFCLIVLAFVVLGVIVLFQGGLITANLLSNDGTVSSVTIFPRNPGSRDYLIHSQKTGILETKDNWLPFGWINIGIELQVVLAAVLIFLSKPDKKIRNFCLLLFGFSLGAIITYNTIIPKYVLSNSNRILVVGYQFLSLINVLLGLLWLLKLKFLRLKYFGLIIFTLLVLLPTILPPLAWMSTTRFGPNKLIPIPIEKRPLEIWLDENASILDRFAILDINSPHPSGAADLMAKLGIKTPLFVGGFKTYTIEPGPEYTDMVYSLNPESLTKLKINKLILDDKYYQTLPEIRKTQLENNDLFQVLYEEKKLEGWQRVYGIKSEYFKTKNLNGSFKDLSKAAPKTGKYYIDSEKNFFINYIRRPLIFTLRDRDLYFETQSGVYQHTETPVNQKDPLKDSNYDFLVLSDTTDPKKICSCEARLIWKYLNGKILLWKTT